MTTSVTAINCTNCAATLDVLGGHRVKSLVCSYCGSIMDSHDGYKLLERYRHNPERPAAPLALGMQAELRRVPFTVIGMIKYVSHQSGPGWEESYDWISFQLYSPTHGYAWLTWNKGHYLFSYRTRDMPHPALPERLVQKSPVRVGDKTFQMFEGYVAAVAYIEGAFTWIAKRGERVHVVEAVDPPWMFSYERGDNELEYAIGEYMDAETVHAAFRLGAPEKPDGIHPAQPFNPPKALPALSKAGPIFAAVALVGLLVVLVTGSGREVAKSFIGNPSASAWTVPFTITDADRLVKVELESPLSNSWIYFDVLVSAVDSDEPVLTLGQEISFYHGRDSDGYWTEGSRRAEALFKLPAAGDYEIEIQASETGGPIPPLDIRIYDRILVKRYIVALLILSVLASLALPFARHRFEKRRWADVLEDDGDD